MFDHGYVYGRDGTNLDKLNAGSKKRAIRRCERSGVGAKVEFPSARRVERKAVESVQSASRLPFG